MSRDIFKKNANFFSGGKTFRKFKKFFTPRHTFATFASRGSYTHHAGRNPRGCRQSGSPGSGGAKERPAPARNRRIHMPAGRAAARGRAHTTPGPRRPGTEPDEQDSAFPADGRRGPGPDAMRLYAVMRPGRTRPTTDSPHPRRGGGCTKREGCTR